MVIVLGVVLIGVWFGQPEEKLPATVGSAVPALPLPIAAPATVPIPAPKPPVAALPTLAKAAPPTPVRQAAQPVNSAPATLPAPPAANRLALTDPLPTQKPLYSGEPASARVTVGGVPTPLLPPNQIGVFPRVYLPQSGQAEVQVQWPDAAPGDQVVAAVEDGGHFADGKPVQAFTLDENREIAFQFQASQSLGNFRVSVRHGAQTKIVSFWAGDRALALNH